MKGLVSIGWRRRLLAAAAAVGISAVTWASAGGSDAALLEPFLESFPSAGRAAPVKLGFRAPRSSQVVEIHAGEELAGYGVSLTVTSRSGKFRMLVALSPDCRVLDVQVPDYPHSRGRAVRKQAFLKQFEGFSYGESPKLGVNVDGISGATSSATAVTKGVRQALIMVHRHINGR